VDETLNKQHKTNTICNFLVAHIPKAGKRNKT